MKNRSEEQIAKINKQNDEPTKLLGEKFVKCQIYINKYMNKKY